MQNTACIDTLYRAANAALPTLGDLVADAARRAPGAVVKLAPIKRRPRAEQKVSREYGGDASRLVDIARAAVVVASPAHAGLVLAFLVERTRIVRVKDRHADPTPNGYRDILVNLVVDTPYGDHIVEVQILTAAMAAVKSQAHKLYARARASDCPAVARRLERRMRWLYGRAWARACRLERRATRRERRAA